MAAFIATSFGCIYVLILLIKSVLACRQIRSRKLNAIAKGEKPSQLQHITIVQPILSGDPLLETILASNVGDLPDEVHFLWMIDQDDVAAQSIAERIKSSLPRNQTRIEVILCSAGPSNVNPKVWKLATALPRITTEFTAVLDDDTSIGIDAIAKAQENLADCDLYTGLPSYRRASNLAGDLVAHFVNSNSALTYLPPLELFEPITINGMFYVARTSTLRDLDAFHAIRHDLCDDIALRKLFAAHHKQVVQGTTTQWINTSIHSWRAYFRLMHRWNLFAIVLLRDIPPVQRLVLAIFLGLPPVLLWMQLIFTVASLDMLAAAVLIGVLLFRQSVIDFLQKQVTHQRVSRNRFVSILSELLQPIHLIQAYFVPHIIWRSRRIHVSRDHRFLIEPGSCV